MGRNETRLGRLEARTMPRSVPFIRVVAKHGELPDNCIRRHGYDPDDPSRNYIVRCIVEPGPGRASGPRGYIGQD
jgi:hypothetical protein